jgi:hypothetical protein
VMLPRTLLGNVEDARSASTSMGAQLPSRSEGSTEQTELALGRTQMRKMLEREGAAGPTLEHATNDTRGT